MALVLSVGVCLCISSCEEADDTSSSNDASFSEDTSSSIETSDTSSQDADDVNTLFTKELLDDVQSVDIGIHSFNSFGSYYGDDAKAVVEMLMDLQLERPETNILGYPVQDQTDVERPYIPDSSFECRINCVSGKTLTFYCTNERISVPTDKKTPLETVLHDYYKVKTKDLRTRLYAALKLNVVQLETHPVKPENTVFTDEFFKDAVVITMCIGSYNENTRREVAYKGDDIYTAIALLKQLQLQPVSKTFGDPLCEDLENKLWSQNPDTCYICYADGRTVRFYFCLHRIAFSETENYEITSGTMPQ